MRKKAFLFQEILTYVFGFSSLLGFIATIVFTVYQLSKPQVSTDFKQILLILSISEGCLLVVFILLAVHYTGQIKNFSELEIQNNILKQEIKEKDRIRNSLVETTHNILHYYRYILYNLDQIIIKLQEAEKKVEEKEFLLILREFDEFNTTLLSNLRSLFGFLTGDSCAICIKIVKNEKFKTLFRDNISYRKRKKMDYGVDGSPLIYDVRDNTAFRMITSPEYGQTTFLCDDLLSVSGPGKNWYVNKNMHWRNLYHACAVVPISKRILGEKNKRHIIGFLCVDNMTGGLENQIVENYLSGIGDILYNLYEKQLFVVDKAIEKGVSHARIEAFKNWGSG